MLLSLSPFTCSYTFICSYALICSASPLYVLFTFFLIFHSCLHKITGVTTLKQHLFRLMMTIVSLWCCVLLLSEGIKTSPLIGTKNQKSENQLWMSTVKPLILRNAIVEASPKLLPFPLWLFWQRGDFFWAVAFSEMRIHRVSWFYSEAKCGVVVFSQIILPRPLHSPRQDL